MRVIRTHDFVLEHLPVERECRSGNPEWGLEPVAVALAHQDGATVGCVGPVVRVTVPPVSCNFSRVGELWQWLGQRFGHLAKWRSHAFIAFGHPSL